MIIDGLADYEDADEAGKLNRLPCRQYETVYYILDGQIYVGWYLAKVGKTTHLILQDKNTLMTKEF